MSTWKLVVGDSEDGPIFLNDDGDRMDRHQTARVVRRLTKRAGIDKNISRTHYVIVSSQQLLTQESPSETSKKPHHMPTRGQR